MIEAPLTPDAVGINPTDSGFIAGKFLSDADQNVAEVLEDTVVATFVCIGKSCPGDHSAKSERVEFVPMGIKAYFDIP